MTHKAAFIKRASITSKRFIAVLAMCFFTSSVHAELYCDSTIKARAAQDRQNAITKDIARFENAYGQPNSFDGMFCGAQITSGFNQLGQSLVGNLSSQINNLINQMFQQACKAAIQPLQNIASMTCIPGFTQTYFNLNFGNLIPNQNKSCPGTQLIQVTPVYGGANFTGGSNYSTPELYGW